MKWLFATAIFSVTALAFTASLAVEDAKELSYEFDPPAFAEDGNGTVFFHFLPTEDQFAANINCMAQPYKGTLEDYDNLSRNQFEQFGMEMVSAENKGDVLTYEYHGKQQGRHLHWYAKAHKRGDKIYLVTATALHSKWQAHSKLLVPAVDSFKLND